jgi:hypothetical protein
MNSELSTLLNDLGMPEDHKPTKIKVVSSLMHDPDKLYSVPGELNNQLRAYEQEIVSDPQQVRTYVTNKLIEISGCGDIKHELKALELLGKISVVNLFSENSQVTVKHTTASDLEEAIKERIKRLLGESVIDVTPEE